MMGGDRRVTKYDRIELMKGDMLIWRRLDEAFGHNSRLHELFVLAVSRSGHPLVSGGPVNLGSFGTAAGPDLLKRRADFYSGKIPESVDVLLLIEVSDSSLSFDQSVKLSLYARYNVASTGRRTWKAKRVVTYVTHREGYVRQNRVRGGVRWRRKRPGYQDRCRRIFG